MLPRLFFCIIHKKSGAADQNEINQQLQQVDIIHFPAGTYTLTDSIILQSNTVLESKPGTLITIPVMPDRLHETINIMSRNLHITIRNLEINANGDGNREKPHGKGYYNCIHYIDRDSFSVYNCVFHDSLGDGLKIKPLPI